MVISFLQRHPKILAGHIRGEDNLGSMLIEILELYGTRFNFDNVGIALDNGGFYFDKLHYQDLNPRMWNRICIRDPNDANNNIAKASHQSDNIIKVFGDAFRALATRCYVVHAELKAREPFPWKTKCGSILDAIIERPAVTGRERLKKLWTENMSRTIELDARPNIPRDPPQPKKSNRRERRAKEKETKETVKLMTEDDAEPAIIIPLPVKRKAPTALISVGTKNMPIVLDDSSNPTSPQSSKPYQPLSKKKRTHIDRTATNLETITG